MVHKLVLILINRLFIEDMVKISFVALSRRLRQVHKRMLPQKQLVILLQLDIHLPEEIFSLPAFGISFIVPP